MKHWLATRLNPLKCTFLHTMEGNEGRGAQEAREEDGSIPPPVQPHVGPVVCGGAEEEEAGSPPPASLALPLFTGGIPLQCTQKVLIGNVDV